MADLCQRLNSLPISVGGAAVYPYREDWMEVGERKAKYPDENGNRTYNLFRVVGTELHRRIWVPRNMAPSIPADLRVVGNAVRYTSAFKPRNSEQVRVIKESVALLQDGQSFMLEAPTGMGKTWCSMDIIAQIGKKTIIVVTKEDVRDQWVAALQAVLGLTLGKEVGLIQGDTCDTVGKKVVIAMIHSLAKESRYPEYHFKDFGFAIWDECHRAAADFFSQSCFRVPAMLRLGISATPDRKDGREEVLYAHIGPPLVVSKLAPMTPRVIAQQSPWEIPMKRKVDSEGRVVFKKGTNDIVMVQLPHSAGKCGHIVKMLSHHHGRNKMIANFVAQCYKSGRKILVQSDTRDHLETLASMIASSGVQVGHISFYVGGLTKAQREKAKLAPVVMATFAQTAEATDIPELDTLVLGSPKSDVRQIVGRILRFMPDKKEPVVFDIRDDTSSVFSGYSNKRDEWYQSIGASVKVASVTAPHLDKPDKLITIAASK